MSGSSSFLVFIANDVTLDGAESALGAHLPLTRDGDALVVRDSFGGELVVGLSAEEHVQVEAAEIAEWKGVPELAECTRRFEVLIADLEACVDEMNTLIETQRILQEISDGWCLLSWNGELSTSRDA